MFFTSLLFGAVHIWPPQVANAFCLGVVLHLIVLWTHSLWLSMLFHALNNLAAFALVKLCLDNTFNIMAADGDVPVPGRLTMISLLTVVVLGSLLYRSRPRWIDAEGNSWTPGFVSPESPPAAALCTRRPQPLGIKSLVAAVLVLLVFGRVFANTVQSWIGLSWCNSALGHFAAGDQEKAFDKFEAALQWDPQLAQVRRSRATIYNTTERFDEAIADCTTILDRDPGDAEAYRIRARAFGGKGNNDRAIADCNVAIRLDPNSQEAYRIRTHALLETNRFDEAIDDCTQALRLGLDDNPDDFYTCRAFAFEALGKHRQAIEDCDRAIAVNEREGHAYSIRGRAHHAQKKYRIAIADFDRSIELMPDWAFNYLYRGKSLREMSKYQQAIRDVSEFIRLAPDAPEGNQLLEELHQAQGDDP